MTPFDARIRFGAAYYHEYQPTPRLDADLDGMVAAGIDVIRVGESVWSTWEPDDGVFDLDWLQPVLDAAHARGIRVIIGTPTYAVPPWLRRKHPEIAIVNRDGSVQPYGGRQCSDYSHPTFRHYAERIIRAIVTRYADHPAVIGWQVDNEPGVRLIHTANAFALFTQWLQARYGDIETLNARWGLTYWSHRLREWDDLWEPRGNTTPSYDLAWRRFQAHLTQDYIEWQVGIVRSLVPTEHFVTSCISLTQEGLDVSRISDSFDIAASNVYYNTQDQLALPGDDAFGGGLHPFFVLWGGPAYLTLQCDVSRGMRQAPFIVTETNATSIGGTADNLPHYDGQLRAAMLAMVARGARLIEFWHWHTLPYGAETYWIGILGHALEPGRMYRELQALAQELEPAQGVLQGLQPTSSVALLIDAASRWALECMGPLSAGPGAWFGDPSSYERIVASMYRGLFDAGLGVDVVAPHQLPDVAAMVRRWPVIVVPAYYVAEDEVLLRLRDYARAGGHLVMTMRSGYADTEAVARIEVMPGVLRADAGFSYLEFSNLTAPVAVEGPFGIAGAATAWADGIIVEGAEVLARYEHPHHGQFAAIKTKATGAGRITYVGTVPDRQLAASLFAWVAEVSGVDDPWRAAMTQTTHAMHATNAGGERLVFVHNWAWAPATVRVPEACCDAMTGARWAAGTMMELGPWDARVLVIVAEPAGGA